MFTYRSFYLLMFIFIMLNYRIHIKSKEVPLKYSYHIHSTHSDGKKNINEIISHAQNLELDEIGISDHFAVDRNRVLPKYKKVKRLSGETIDGYIQSVQQFSEQKNPIVKLGVEADFIPDLIDQTRELLENKPFDYIIGAVHVVEGVFLSIKPKNNIDLFCTTIMKKYWILIAQMAKSNTFDIVAHIDLTKRFNLHPTIDLSSEIDAALKAIAQAGMTVELNTSGWHVPAKEQYPSRELLEKCFELGIPVMVTSDAHTPEYLCRDFEKAFALLKEIGYTHVAYYKKRKRFFTPIPNP